MSARTFCILLSVTLGIILGVYGLSMLRSTSVALGTEKEDLAEYVRTAFPAGLYGEMSMNMNEHYTLFRNQKGLLLSYAYRSLNDNILGVAGPKSKRDNVRELNARVVSALIHGDRKEYVKLETLGGDPGRARITSEWWGRIFDQSAKPFLGCTDAVVVGEVYSEGCRHLLVQSVRGKSKAASNLVFAYREYEPGKWRSLCDVNDCQYAPIFSNALTGPPLDITGLPADWRKGYVVLPIPVPDTNMVTLPANEILLRAQRADTTETGRAIEAVLDELMAAVKAFPDDKQESTVEAWKRIAETVTPEKLRILHDSYKWLTQEDWPVEHWRGGVEQMLSPWDVHRFVIDCDKEAFLLCVGDDSQFIGCLCFLRDNENRYRICDESDLTQLVRDENFSARLKEELLLIP